MSKDYPYFKICSTWQDLADATTLAVKAAQSPWHDQVCVPVRMNVRGICCLDGIDLQFPWGSEKVIKPYEGFAVADPCQGEWVLKWRSTQLGYKHVYDTQHIFTFEYVPARPRKSYNAAEVDVIESAAVQRGRDYFIAGNQELQKLKQDAHAAGYAYGTTTAKQATEDVLKRMKEDAHAAGFKEGYQQGGIDLGIAKDVIRRDAYDEGYKQGLAHEKGYTQHKREVSYAQGYEKGVEHGKELVAKRVALTATQVNAIQDEARADERSIFYAGVKQVLATLKQYQASADAGTLGYPYDDYERGHATGRGWALSKTQFLLKKTFPNL